MVWNQILVMTDNCKKIFRKCLPGQAGCISRLWTWRSAGWRHLRRHTEVLQQLLYQRSTAWGLCALYSLFEVGTKQHRKRHWGKGLTSIFQEVTGMLLVCTFLTSISVKYGSSVLPESPVYFRLDGTCFCAFSFIIWDSTFALPSGKLSWSFPQLFLLALLLVSFCLWLLCHAFFMCLVLAFAEVLNKKNSKLV